MRYGRNSRQASRKKTNCVRVYYTATLVPGSNNNSTISGLGAIGLLERYAGLRAIVLDLPHVVRIASEQSALREPVIRERLDYVGGDMFESVPEADVYIIKHIIHDWGDEKCIRLLDNCRRRMHGEGRLLCIDTVVEPVGTTSDVPAKLVDVLMMVLLPGRERTEIQWRQLYNSAGFEIQRIIRLHDNIGTSIVEGVKRRS